MCFTGDVQHMAEYTEHGIGLQDTPAVPCSQELSTVVDVDSQHADIRLANWIMVVHLLYCLLGVLINITWIVLVMLAWLNDIKNDIWISRSMLLGLTWQCPTWACKLWWNTCPMTLAEQSLRCGKDMNDPHWKYLRKKMTFRQTAIWSFVHPVLVWAISMCVAIVILVFA